MKVLLLTAALISPAYQGVSPVGRWDSATTSQDYRRDPAGPWYDAEHIAK